MTLVTKEFEESFVDYPLYSQEAEEDPIVIAKLHIPNTEICWYLLEYDPNDKIAYCFVTGLGCDEFGYVSLVELESIKLANGIAVKQDMEAEQKHLSECLITQ